MNVTENHSVDGLLTRSKVMDGEDLTTRNTLRLSSGYLVLCVYSVGLRGDEIVKEFIALDLSVG